MLLQSMEKQNVSTCVSVIPFEPAQNVIGNVNALTFLKQHNSILITLAEIS